MTAACRPPGPPLLQDSLTYLVAAWCAWQLPSSLGATGAQHAGAAAGSGGSAAGARRAKKSRSDRVLDVELPRQLDGGREGPGEGGGPGSEGEAVWLLAASEARGGQEQGPSHPTRAERRHAAAAGGAEAAATGARGSGSGQEPGQQPLVSRGSAEWPRGAAAHDPRRKEAQKLKHSDLEEAPLAHQPARPHLPSGGGARGGGSARGSGELPASTAAAALHAGTAPVAEPPAAPASLLGAAAAGWREGVEATLEGWRYVATPANRDVAAMATIKCCGSLVWGAVDVLNVRYIARRVVVVCIVFFYRGGGGLCLFVLDSSFHPAAEKGVARGGAGTCSFCVRVPR